MTLTYDLGGNDLVVNTLSTGATGPGQSGTATPVLLTSTNQTVTGVKTFSANPVLTVGNTIKSNVAATTFTSNAATGTSYFVQATTPALTTAAGASQTEVYTLTGVAATDIAFVSSAGGTNTRKNINLQAVCTTDTVTVTIYNSEPTNAVNGTIIFNLMILKA